MLLYLLYFVLTIFNKSPPQGNLVKMWLKLNEQGQNVLLFWVLSGLWKDLFLRWTEKSEIIRVGRPRFEFRIRHLLVWSWVSYWYSISRGFSEIRSVKPRHIIGVLGFAQTWAVSVPIQARLYSDASFSLKWKQQTTETPSFVWGSHSYVPRCTQHHVTFRHDLWGRLGFRDNPHTWSWSVELVGFSWQWDEGEGLIGFSCRLSQAPLRTIGQLFLQKVGIVLTNITTSGAKL